LVIVLKDNIMKVKIYLCFIILLSSVPNWASNDNNPIGGRVAGMGFTGVTLTDSWSVQNNQAGLGFVKNISAGMYYENHFLVKELSSKSVAFVLPTQSGVFGLNMNYFGYEKYNETKLGLAYGKAFGEKISAGIQLDYLNTHIAEDYGNKGNMTFEIGILSKLNKSLTIGAHVFNPIRVKVADYNDERIATIFKLGLSYNFSNKVLVIAETEKNINYKPQFKAGLEYHIIKEIYLRTGLSTNPTQNTFGIGIELKKIKIDLASSYHQVLGYSPQMSLVYNFN
jgi:hypothetical protein